MKNLVLTIATITLLAGCSTGATSSVDEAAEFTPVSFASTNATPEEAANCEKAGGEILKRGRLQAEHCVLPYPDAGETCSGASECVGRCVLEVEISNPVPGTSAAGVCQEDTNDFGCRTLVNNGQIEGTICID